MNAGCHEGACHFGRWRILPTRWTRAFRGKC